MGSTVLAQQVSGTLTCSCDNQPIEGATVFQPQLKIHTTTDENGSFELSLPAGNHSLIFSALGYKTKPVQILVSEDQKNLIYVQMDSQVIEFDEVVVSTPFHKIQSENITKVSSLQLSKTSPINRTRLPEALQNIPGLRQQSTGNGIGKPVIRGLGGNRVVTYAQGIRLENQQFGDEHGLNLSSEGVESVEIIKGPASLLYGSDAIAGVLYLNPERFAPFGQNEGDISYGFLSNNLGHNFGLGYKISGKKLQGLVRYSTQNAVDYRQGNNQRVPNSRWKARDFKLGLAWAQKKGKTEIRYNNNLVKLGLPETDLEAKTTRNPDEPFQEIDQKTISLDQKLFVGKVLAEAKVGHAQNIRKEFEAHKEEGHEHGEAALNMKLTSSMYELKIHTPNLRQVETVIGIQGMLQKNKNVGEEILIPNAKKQDFGTFAIFSIHRPKVSGQAGIRFDKRNIQTESYEINHVGEPTITVEAVDKKFKNWTASTGLKWNFNENSSWRLHYASGFRAPNLSELSSFGVHHGTNRFEKGNNKLKAEKNHQFDLSLEINKKHWFFVAEGFYNDFKNFIFIAPTAEIEDGNPVYQYTQSNAHLFGGEFQLHLHPHPLDWLHVVSSYDMVIGKQQGGNYLPLMPAPRFQFETRFDLPSGTIFQKPHLSTKAQFVGKQDKTHPLETPTKAYELIGIEMGSSFECFGANFQATLQLQNLLDKSFVSHLSRLKYDGLENVGRSINFSISSQF